MSNIFIPETVDIPFDSLTNEQRDAIVLIMTEKGFQNPLTDIIDKALNLCDIEIQNFINFFPLPFVDDPWPGQNALSINGFYPLYATPEEAIEKSPLPNYSRPGETTEGYHIHILNGTPYYMPNGLGGPNNIMGTQFHGTHGTTGYGVTGEEETTTYYYDESGATITPPNTVEGIFDEVGNNAYDPLSILYQMGEGGWTIGVPPVADEVTGNSYGACIVNGVCEINTIPGCNNIGGVFMGENTVCAGDYLTGDIGSCCQDVYGNCVELNELDCSVAGGVYGGSGSTCGAMGSTIGANGETVYLLCSNETTLSNLTRFDIFLSSYTGTFTTNEAVFSENGFSALVDSWYPQSGEQATLRVYDIFGTLSSGVSGGPPPDIVTGANSGATGLFSHIIQSPTGDTATEEGDGGGTYSAPQGHPGGYTSDWVYDEYGITIGGGVYFPPTGADTGIIYGDAPVYVPEGPEEIEYTLFSGPIPGTPFDVDSVPPPVEVLPLSRGQADVIINALEKIKLNLHIFKHHTNTISGVDGESMEQFFHRLSTAGAYTNIMKTIADRGEHSYSFVFGTIMGLGDIMLDKILKGTECAPCLNCKESATVTSGSGIGGIAQEIWLNPSAYNSALERLEEIALSILALIDEEEEKYCKAQKVVHNYTTGQQLLNETKNDPIFESLVDRVFSSPQLKSKIKEVNTDSTTDKFFPSFKLLEQKTSVTLAELAVAPYPDLGSPCVCIDCEDDDIKLQRYLIKIFSSLGKGVEDGVSCKAGVLSSTEFLEGPVGPPGTEGLIGNIGIPGPPGICDYGPCEQEPAHYGACCLTQSTCGNCIQTNQEQCDFYGGDYHGDDTHCTFEQCGKCFSNAECVTRGEVCCNGTCLPPPCPVCETDDDCPGVDSCCFSGQCSYCPAPTCNPPCGPGLTCCDDFTCCPTCCGGYCCGENAVCCDGSCCLQGQSCCAGVCCDDVCCGDSCGCPDDGSYCCSGTCCPPPPGCGGDDDCGNCQHCNLDNNRCEDDDPCVSHPPCPAGSYPVADMGTCTCSCYIPQVIGEDDCCRPSISCPDGFTCIESDIYGGCSCIFNACVESECENQGGQSSHRCTDNPNCESTDCCCASNVVGYCCEVQGIDIFCPYGQVCPCTIGYCHSQDCCGPGGHAEPGGECDGVWHHGYDGLDCYASCADWIEWWQQNGGIPQGGGGAEAGGGGGGAESQGGVPNWGTCCGDGCGCDEFEVCCGDTCCAGECCGNNCFPIIECDCCGSNCCTSNETCCSGECCPDNIPCCSDECCLDGNECCGGDGDCCDTNGDEECCGSTCCSSDEFCYDESAGICCERNYDGSEATGPICSGQQCPCPEVLWNCDANQPVQQSCCAGQCSIFCCGNDISPVPSDFGCCQYNGTNWDCNSSGNAEEWYPPITSCGDFTYSDAVNNGVSEAPGCPCDCRFAQVDNPCPDATNDVAVYYWGTMGAGGLDDCNGRWFNGCNNKWESCIGENCDCSPLPCIYDNGNPASCYCGDDGWCGIKEGNDNGICNCAAATCVWDDCHPCPAGEGPCFLECVFEGDCPRCDDCRDCEEICNGYFECGTSSLDGTCLHYCNHITNAPMPGCESSTLNADGYPSCPCDEPACGPSPPPPIPPPPAPPGYPPPEGSEGGPSGLNNELSTNKVINAEISFQIVNFVADEKIKTPGLIQLYGSIADNGGSISHKSSAELREDASLGKENFEDNNATTSVVRGSLTATITNDGTIGENQIISFVSGSNIKLTSNEYKNMIRISADDLSLTEILDVQTEEELKTGSKYWLIRGLSGASGHWYAEDIIGTSGDIGFEGYTGPTGGTYSTEVTTRFILSRDESGVTFTSNSPNISYLPYKHWFNIGTSDSGISTGTIVNITNGFTSGGDIMFQSSVVSGADFSNTKEPLKTHDINFAIIPTPNDAHTHYITGTGTTGNCNILFAYPSEAGSVSTMTLYIENGGLFANHYGCFCQGTTVYPDASILWAGGTEPTLSTAGVDVISFLTIDGGTVWYGVQNGINFNS